MLETRTRRSEADRIADLEAQIERSKARSAAKKVKRDPSLRHISAAARSIDKALSTVADAATKAALVETRTALGACLSLNGVTARATRGVLVPRARPSANVGANAVLAYVTANPGARGEHIAAALGTDTKTILPVIHRPIDEGRIRAPRMARETTYVAV